MVYGGELMSLIVLRTIVLYVLIVFGLRIMGKRQLGELQPSELVITIIISNIATLPIENPKISFFSGALPILTLVCFEVFISLISLKFPAVRKAISGSPVVVIRDGKIDQKELKNLRFSVDDLLEQLRIGGIFDISEVSYAIVETTGKLSVFQLFNSRSTTNGTMNIKENKDENNPPAAIISDGVICKEALDYCNVDEQWLNKVLKEKGTNPSKVFLMVCDKAKNYKIILKE